MVYVTIREVILFVTYMVGSFSVLVASYVCGWSDRESRAAVNSAAIVGGVMLLVSLFT